MRTLLLIGTIILSFTPVPSKADEIIQGKDTTMKTQILKAGTNPSIVPPAEWFTGTVRLDSLSAAPEPSQVSVGHVTFEPGARTAWHDHPYGQTLIITFGKGWIQEDGQERVEVKAGDIVHFPANVKHWHGATDTTAMTHYAIQESKDGSNVTWMEHVSDEQYKK